MYKFSKKSKQILLELDLNLYIILTEAIEFIDFSVICGYRNKKEQNEAFKTGKSKAKFGQSKHNVKPAKAVDIAPYPIDWEDIYRFKKLADLIFKIADKHNIKIVWGGNFLTFKDWGHFELK